MKKSYLLLCVLFYSATCYANDGKLFAHDLKVVIIYVPAQVAVGIVGTVDFPTALIKNTGTDTITTFKVTLTMTGVNPYAFTHLITTTLAPDSFRRITFPSHAITAIGFDTLTVSLDDDDDNTNNSLSFIQENTAGVYSYADTAPVTGSFGFGTGSGMMLTKYNHNGHDKVTAVRVHISSDPENIGKTVYAVVLTSNAGGTVSQSANVVLSAADLGKYMLFPVSPTPFNNDPLIWVGLAQTTGSSAYYPVSTQAEIPTRILTYYTRDIIGGSVSLMQDSSHGRYMIQAILNNTVIPVILGSFTAKRNGTVNELAWITSQEINSKEFIIERSNDGITFTSIGHVNAAGNSSTVLHYHFTDNNPIKGMNYYRLRSVDMDAEFKLSEIRTVRNSGNIDITIYPNPVKEIMNVEVNSTIADKGVLTVTDITGKKLYTQSLNVIAGNNIIKINTANILPGVYILHVKLSRDKLVKQLCKM